MALAAVLSSLAARSHGSFAAFSARLMIALDHLLRRLVREHDRAEHDLFRQFLGFGFDHHHRVVRAGDDQFELAWP